MRRPRYNNEKYHARELYEDEMKCDPVIKALAKEIQGSNLSFHKVALRAGFAGTNVIYDWIEGYRDAKLSNLRNVLEVIGYRLIIVPIHPVVFGPYETAPVDNPIISRSLRNGEQNRSRTVDRTRSAEPGGQRLLLDSAGGGEGSPVCGEVPWDNT